MLALNGPLAFTPRQTRRIVKDLDGGPTDTTDVEVAVSKATDRLPTEPQIHAICQTLHQCTRQ